MGSVRRVTSSDCGGAPMRGVVGVDGWVASELARSSAALEERDMAWIGVDGRGVSGLTR